MFTMCLSTQGTLCWAHTPGVILDEPECPLVPQLPALPAGWHCCPVVADLARRVTPGKENVIGIHRRWRGSGHVLALSLPQWLHLSRTNVRALAMNHKALCILAPSLMSAPALSSLTLSLPPSHTAGSYLRDCSYSPLLLEPSAARHQHGSRPHRLGAALSLLTVSPKTPLHCCLIPHSLPLL